MTIKNNILFYVESVNGCAIHSERTITKAREIAIHDVGFDNFKSIRLATENDVAWVSAMGGYVPDGKIYKPKRI